MSRINQSEAYIYQLKLSPHRLTLVVVSSAGNIEQEMQFSTLDQSEISIIYVNQSEESIYLERIAGLIVECHQKIREAIKIDITNSGRHQL